MRAEEGRRGREEGRRGRDREMRAENRENKTTVVLPGMCVREKGDLATAEFCTSTQATSHTPQTRKISEKHEK